MQHPEIEDKFKTIDLKLNMLLHKIEQSSVEITAKFEQAEQINAAT